MNPVVNVRAVFSATLLGFAGMTLTTAGCRRSGGPAGATPPTAAVATDAPPEDTIGPFFVGVSSLDVEANDRAARLFDELSKRLPDEPAVWANLGLARLKLGDVPGAQQALGHAIQLAPTNGPIALLQATVEEDQGQFAPAIARLRSVAKPSPAVLYRIGGLLERTGQPADLREELSIFDQILEREPNNLVVVFSRARLAARLQDKPLLASAIDRFNAFRAGWTPAAVHQLEAAKAAAETGNFRRTAAQLTFLENVVLPTPAYQAALASLGGTNSVTGQPVREFLKYTGTVVAVAPADTGLTFDVQPATAIGHSPELCVAAELTAKLGATVMTLANGNLSIGGTELPVHANGGFGTEALCAADLNGDYQLDLAWVDRNGLQIWTQDQNGHFAAYAPNAAAAAAFKQPAHGVWAVDFDADGDLDLLVARDSAAPQILRNDGDGSYAPLDILSAFPEVRDICWADLDGDGVGDLAMLDATGRVLVSWNDRAGAFATPQPVLEVPVVALTRGDIDGDGEMALVALAQDGSVHGVFFNRDTRTWTSRELVRWPEAPKSGEAHIAVADLDNNGAADLVVSVGKTSAIWLNDGQGKFLRLEQSPAMAIASVADVDGDGLLDLVGLTDRGAAVAHGHGTKGYHWQSIETRALSGNADGRINSFGIGGRVEIRAGALLAMAPITAPHTHFGLGGQKEVGVARIVWPNGASQVEFSPPADQVVIATQRLKGSCPWVFTRTGDGFQFVKDFIWRSPLGMRINSQDTAGVNQTEDWILIPGRDLTPEKGEYEVRITAELWETHFFDHVSLRVVDHPASVDAFVDERFVPAATPKLQPIATTPPQPLENYRDQSGRDVSSAVAAVDGNYVDSFPLGRFQGIAADHWLEFQVPANAPLDRPLVLVGNAWIYPTDSSLNVAISQGNNPKPQDLVLEAYEPDIGWRAVSGDLGFPAGKNKNVIIPLPHDALAAGQRRFRLRTNLEIYWDYLGWAVELPASELKVTPTETRVAELRYRGFSDLGAPIRRKPDRPSYPRLVGTGQRWQDLEGYYTRFGDVRELLQAVDDRYVIMNAGDELRFRFAAPPPPPAGWTRDFILVGDGWVKDGDFNTANSRTVLPLPMHGESHYGSPAVSLELDPVYQKHRDDWVRFHTRYVSPAAFERGLMRGVAKDDGGNE